MKFWRNWKEWWSFWIFSFAFAVALAGPTAYYWKAAPGWMVERAPASRAQVGTFFPCRCIQRQSDSLYDFSMVIDIDRRELGLVKIESRLALSNCTKKLIEIPYCAPINQPH